MSQNNSKLFEDINFDNILLIDPNWKHIEKGVPSLSLGYISTFLQLSGNKVFIEDFITNSGKEKINETENLFIQQLKYTIENNNITFVGINCSFGNIPRVKRIIESLNNLKKPIYIAIGGSFLNLLYGVPNGYKLLFDQMPNFDCAIWGDGELSFFNFVKYRKSNKYWIYKPGIIGKFNGNIILNKPYDLRNIDIYPFPKWDNFNALKYIDVRFIIASRGCKYNCSFCDEKLLGFGKFRNRNPFDVFSEIEYNVLNGIDKFKFQDSSFTSYLYLSDFCELLIENDFNIKYSCLGRTNEIVSNPDILNLLEKSGCRSIEYGIESGNDAVLSYIKKGISREDVIEAVKLTKEYGIKTQGSFIIGLPKESYTSICDTIDFAKDLDLDIYRWHIFQPSVSQLLSYKKISIQDIYHFYCSYLEDSNDISYFQQFVNKDLIMLEPHFLKFLDIEKIEKYGNIKMVCSDLTLNEAYTLYNLALEETKGRLREEDEFKLL